MKYASLCAFLVLSGFAIASSAQTADQSASSTTPNSSVDSSSMTANPTDTSSTVSNTLTNSSTATQTSPVDQQKVNRVLQTLIAVDNNEINAANEAQKRSSNSDVKDFAQTMVTDHTKNMQDAQALAQQLNVTLSSTEKMEKLKDMGKQELHKLQSVPAAQFDMVYINAMVEGHQKVLNMIDEKLLPNAKNQDVINFLKTTRDTVSHHLDMAKDVQTKLKANKS